MNINKIIREHCYLQGEFHLSSGGWDTNYIDLWQILTRKFYVKQIAELIIKKPVCSHTIQWVVAN